MTDSEFGFRDSKGNYSPNKRVGYPPIFIWPLQPLNAIKWIFSIPGYFVPWNAFYVFLGLVCWFYLSPPLASFANPTPQLALLIFLRNCLLVIMFFGAFHYHLYLKRAQNS